jgi:hypothetical protein
MRRGFLCLAPVFVVVIACSVGPVVSPTPGQSTSASPQVVAPASIELEAPPAPTPRTTPPPGTITRFDTAELADGSRLLTLQFVGGAVYSATDPCSHRYSGWAEQVGDALEVAVVDVTAPPARPCDAIGFGRQVSVRLPAPFLGSRLNDLAGYVHFVRNPAELVELRGLPAGWLLRSSGDVEESPTGRWQRTYSPLPDPELGTSKNRIDFYQAFDGPAGVTGGEEQRTVTVNGQPATLYRFAPDGELVLVWTLGSDGLALVVNERNFPVDRLIALAESATRP